LASQADKKRIPKLFDEDAEIPYSVDAKNALDDTIQVTTIDQRFGPSSHPLHQALRRLGRAVLERLRIPVPPKPEVDLVESQGVNQEVSVTWAR
jgi:hypothetical protein